MMRKSVSASLPRLMATSAAKASSSADLSATASAAGSGAKKTKSMGRRVLEIGLISVTAGVFLSGVNDLAIFHGCSSKAIEKASQNQKLVEALGLPIVRGPWYDSSLAVGHRRHSVSCTFPVSGPQGSGIFQLKAIRQGDDSMFSFLRHNDWDILIMEALLHVPANDEKNQMLRINFSEGVLSPTNLECLPCKEYQQQQQDSACPRN